MSRLMYETEPGLSAEYPQRPEAGAKEERMHTMNELWPHGKPALVELTTPDGADVEVEPSDVANLLILRCTDEDGDESALRLSLAEARRLFTAGLAMCDAAEGVKRECECPGGPPVWQTECAEVMDALGCPDHVEPVTWVLHIVGALQALAAPEGVDPVEWAGLAGEGMEVAADGMNVDRLIEWGFRVKALRTPPRALPDGPGQWWGSYGAGPMLAWDVEERGDGDAALLACTKRRPAHSLWSPVEDEVWTWLTIDGHAVRVEPPRP